MNPARIAASGFQIPLIRRVEQRHVVVQDGTILLLEHRTVFAQHLSTVFIVPSVLCHLVDEEQREALDAPVKELFLFLEVGEDRFPDLDAAHVLLGHIAHHVASLDDFAVGKGHGIAQRVDF